MPKLYIVTGAYGHLGNTIVRMLCEQGHRVRGFVMPNDKTNALPDTKAIIYFGDILNQKSLESLFDISDTIYKPEDIVVIHTAGIVSISSHYEDLVHKVNVEGTRNVVNQCIKSKIGKLIYTSSVHAIPEPSENTIIREVTTFDPNAVVGLYAKTKAEATQIVLDSCKLGLNATIVHPSGIIGPNDYGSGHLTQLIRDFVDGRLTACIKGGYDFVDVRDVAKGILLASDIGKAGKCYILSGHYLKVEELLHKLHIITNRKAITTVLPIWFAKFTAPLSELYYKLLKQPPLYTRYSIYTLSTYANFSNELAQIELGYQVRPIEDTLKDTYQWLIQHGKIKHTNQKKAS